ncbi:MAG: DinB family protein [Promethearchaeota archaeon]
MNSADIERLANWSDTIRNSSLKKFKSIPIGYENYRLFPDQMSVADLVLHLIESDTELFKAKTQNFTSMNLGQANKVFIHNREEYDTLLIKLEEQKTKRRNFILSMSDELLGKTITGERIRGNVKMTLLELIYEILDHEIHHKGQLSIYIRGIAYKRNGINS